MQKMSSRIDKVKAQPAQLKKDVKTFEAELAPLVRGQAEMDHIRQESHANYVTGKADLKLGPSGVRETIGLLRDYYGSSASLLQDDGKFGAFMQQPAASKIHVKALEAGRIGQAAGRSGREDRGQ